MNWDWEKLQEKRRRQPGGGGGGPNFSEMQFDVERFRKFRFPGGKIAIAIVALLWLASGVYTVGPDEVGVVRRFGAFERLTDPGLHYRIPYPVEMVQTPKVSKIRRVEVGFKSIKRRGEYTQDITDVTQESLMLTGDENIVDVKFIVQYKISDPAKFLFNLKNQETTVKSVAEASMREVVGYNKIDSVLTTDKLIIQNECRENLQDILDRYDCGVRIVAVQLQDVHPPREVIDAFKDVASAREDKSRYINEADAYSNDILPKARGRAAAMINEAQAFRETQIRQAKGEASRFLSVLKEYNKAKDVTRKRLYIEAMESIFSSPGLEKIIMTDAALKGAVPYLPLDPAARRVQESKGGKN